MSNVLEQVVAEFGLPESPKENNISKETIVKWVQTDDIEALGALYSYLMDDKYARRVIPALTLPEYVEFVTRYFSRCFQESPDGEWSHSRYAAAWDLSAWFRALWKDNRANKLELKKLKDWLAKTYKASDEPVRTCIVNGTLEHLFENTEIAKFFADWQKDDELIVAYSLATEWSNPSKA